MPVLHMREPDGGETMDPVTKEVTIHVASSLSSRNVKAALKKPWDGSGKASPSSATTTART
jgi:hypothetical protein